MAHEKAVVFLVKTTDIPVAFVIISGGATFTH